MSFVRTNTAASSELVSCDGARTTKWITPRSGNSVMEIQTYPDSSTITKAQRDQLSMLISGLFFFVIQSILIQFQTHQNITTGIKKSTSLLPKGTLYAPFFMCQSLGHVELPCHTLSSRAEQLSLDPSFDRESLRVSDFGI
jgi:hypothetical protein